jgi:hypothetical protein
LTGYLASGFAKKPPVKTRATTTIMLTIEPRLELPPEDTEAGLVTRMLLVENIMPDDRKFISMEDSLTTMQWMRFVFVNRLKYGKPQYFGADKSVTTLTALIKSHRQVEGFEYYPKIAPKQKQVLDDVLSIINESGDKRLMLYRQYVQNAIDVANGIMIGSDPCPTGLYAWYTEDAKGSPGGDYIFYMTRGGQKFYTLKK